MVKITFISNLLIFIIITLALFYKDYCKKNIPRH